MAEETTDFPAMLREIRQKDPRFTAEAYAFTFQGLDYTMHEMKGKRQHVSGQDLLEGIRRLAAKEFGRLAPMVFKAWGVTQSSHFGDIVYNLIEAGVMKRRDEDKREDFDGGWDLATAFEKEEEGGQAKE
ncbi:MAG: hypothetical protein FD180_608 [Planctomycetota bacterium]|nr:MAG: hypothetical protein FD180_608 [Planctomycetota bacterium]